ncbi:MAG: outer membrane beta-barrel family protein [Bacteroidales bacterium]|nr:outer membrane beta-barrel family protein [Bacteroidales bacterium]
MRTKLIILTAVSLIAINLKARDANPIPLTDTTITPVADTTQTQEADTTAVKVRYADSTTAADTTELHYELEGTTLTINGTTQAADRRTFSFTEREIRQAYSSLDLVSTLPGLSKDLVSGGIKGTDGSTVLFLINGVKATNEEITALPKGKIKSVDFYDIPPARYADVDRVINIVTAPLDDGFIVSVEGSYGLTSHYSDDSFYFAWNKGRSKLSASYSFSWRDVPDRQVESWLSYTLHGTGDISSDGSDGTDYSLHYLEKNHFGYEDHEPIVKYSYVNYDKTIFEISAKPNYDHWYSLSPDGTGEYTEGDNAPRSLTTISNSVINTFSPSVDAYFWQRLSPKDELSVNLVGTLYNVKQVEGLDQEYFTDDGEPAFDDDRDLLNRKWSVIGEAAYTRKVFGSANWNTGYRINASFLHSKAGNSFGDFDYRSRFLTHYAYTEVSGTWRNLTYRVSLGLNCTDNNADDVHVRNVNFTPRVIVGYNLPKNNSLRFQYLRTASSPDINNLSSNISNNAINIVSTGNPELQNSVRQQISLTYNYSNDYIDLTVMPYYLHTKRPFVSYYEQGLSPLDEVSPTYWSRTVNGTWMKSGGAQFTVDIMPLGNEMLIIEGYFWPHRSSLHSDKLDCALTSLGNYISLEFNWKWFTLDYQLNFPVFDISGSSKSTDENANHLSLDFKIKNWKVNASWLWIGKGAHYETESLSGLAVKYRYVTDFFDQKNLVVLGVSYYFQSGKDKRYSRKLNNADYASPTK